jgi:glycosyltransferase involved in cell wall biosynthesis
MAINDQPGNPVNDVPSQERQRVLVVTSTFPRWRGDREPPFVFELCKRLIKYVDVHVLAPHAPGACLDETLDGVKVTRFRYFFEKGQKLTYEGGVMSNLRQHQGRYLLVPFFLIGELVALVRLLRRNRFDVIHAHWLFPQGFLAVIAARLAGGHARVLTTSHGADLYGLNHPLFRWLKKFTATSSAALTVVSRSMKRTLKGYGVEPERIDVLPMGVDLTQVFVPGPEESLNTKSLLFVGRLVEKKGVEYLIRAMAQVHKKHPDAVLTCIGSGPLENELKALVGALGLTGVVSFPGSVENSQLPSYYQKHAIVVFPSVVAETGDQEGFGLVLVEALGCGCAVVATDLPAMQDIIDAESAVIVAQKNPAQLADAIVRLLDAPGYRRKLAAAGRDHVVRHYDWNIIGEKYADIIRRL